MFSITSTFNPHTRCTQESPSMDASSRGRRSVSPTMWANLTHYSYRNRSFEPGLDFEEKPIEACHSLYFLLDFFHQYYIPSIILLGLVGNLLSCVVFLNTHLRIRSSSYYLAALATADFGFLVTLLLVWLNNTLGWKVFNKDGWCETLVYVSAVCSSLSVWLIVAFTVERFIAVQYPLHRPHICTIARAKTIVLVLVILALTSHSYSFVTAGVVVNKDGEEYCDLKVEYLETMKIISIIDSIASLIAPLVLIIVMNTMIMRNLLRFSRRFKQTSTTSTDCPSRERSDINLNQIPVSRIYYVYCTFFFVWDYDWLAIDGLSEIEAYRAQGASCILVIRLKHDVWIIDWEFDFAYDWMYTRYIITGGEARFDENYPRNWIFSHVYGEESSR
ncbi:Neuropeptides capa receptor [Anthophora quadrimaculata]